MSFGKTFGEDADKVRVASADVLAVVDVPKLARAGVLSRANLSRANLSGATGYLLAEEGAA